MATSGKGHPHIGQNEANGRAAHIGSAASKLLDEGKKLANELYKEGMNRMDEVQDNAIEHSDQVLKKVQENPLASVLIAAGVGFLISSLLRK